MLFAVTIPNRASVQPHPSVVTRHSRAISPMHATRSKDVVLWPATSAAWTLRHSLISSCIIGHSLTGFDPDREAADAAAADGTNVPDQKTTSHAAKRANIHAHCTNGLGLGFVPFHLATIPVGRFFDGVPSFAAVFGSLIDMSHLTALAAVSMRC